MIKKIFKRIVIGIFITITCWCTFFFTDYSLAKATKAPIFASNRGLICSDGGSAEYWGLGYKVNVYVRMVPDAEEEIKTEIYRVDFGSWSMPGLFQ